MIERKNIGCSFIKRYGPYVGIQLRMFIQKELLKLIQIVFHVARCLYSSENVGLLARLLYGQDGIQGNR
ncbi:hypothetical protein AXG89_33955 [Burkholderia sp. PAMC 26561]|nr:hypothetical protein AXG89_33955 [Burkholderia sp. PAMC 26561]